MHKRVLKSIQFAESSISLLCISARLKITAAQGVPDRINTLALNVWARGIKYTQR